MNRNFQAQILFLKHFLIKRLNKSFFNEKNINKHKFINRTHGDVPFVVVKRGLDFLQQHRTVRIRF